MSQGQAALFHALLNQDGHELKSAVEQAKSFLVKNRYARLVELDSLTAKADFDVFLLGLAKVVQALYKNSAKSGRPAQTSKLTSAMRLILDARQDLALNVAPKLIALRLALNLKV